MPMIFRQANAARCASPLLNRRGGPLVVFTIVLLASGLNGSVSWSQVADPIRDRATTILERRCLSCHHGADAKGGLSLESRAMLLAGGESGPAVEPGEPAKSLLIAMIEGDSPQMPKQGGPLPIDEITALRNWVAGGVRWPDGVVLVDRRFEGESWWSLKPLRRPDIPQIASPWIRTPVDAFILQTLMEHGLAPSPDADRLTLLRRVKFDLHGLPPSPDEVDAFLADASSEAYERLVDRLLASPRYGERWGRHWLDIVHFGETHGYDKDKVRLNAWPYRDYVIDSLNRDKPYSRFIQEQLAGDILMPGEPDGIVATGFIVAGPWDFVGHVELREGTVDKLIARSNDRDDMVMTTMSTFASMTVHCARCHDHKFDPISQADYYRLQAVFAGVERADQPYLADPNVREALNAILARLGSLRERHKAAVVAMQQARSPETDLLAARLESLKAELAGIEPVAIESPTNGYHSGIEPSPDVEKWVQVDLGEPRRLDVVRLTPARPTDFPDTPGFGFPARFKVEAATAADFSDRRILADYTDAEFANPGDAPLEIDARSEVGRYVRVTAHRLWARTNDFVFALGELEVESEGANVAAMRPVTVHDSIEAGRWGARFLVDGFDSRNLLTTSRLPDSPVARRRTLEADVKAVELERHAKTLALLPQSVQAELRDVPMEIAAAERERAALPPMLQTFAAANIPPRPVALLRRGSVREPAELMMPSALSCVPGLDGAFAATDPADGQMRRAQLADWLTDPRNVLVRRSIVNRVWQYHFGKGIVETPNDFGRMGGLPSHPALLDWLAVEFLEGGESLKRLHRLLVTSSSYRQSSRHDDAAAKVDASNRLLWRANRSRLDAEGVRDALLAISGRLDLTMGGPSVQQFSFKDDHSPVYDYAKFDVNDARANRRAVYRFLVRSSPDPFMECLDCADPSLLSPKRNTTLTSLQALALLNNRFVVKQCEQIAERIAASEPDLTGQLRLAFKLAYGREPGADELQLTIDYAREYGLASACRLLVNANEFSFVD